MIKIDGLKLELMNYLNRMQSKKHVLFVSLLIVSLILSGLAFLFREVASPLPDEVKTAEATLSQTDHKLESAEAVKKYQNEINAIVLKEDASDIEELKAARDKYRAILVRIDKDKSSFDEGSSSVAQSISVELSSKISEISARIKASYAKDAPPKEPVVKVEEDLLPIDPDSCPEDMPLTYREIRAATDESYDIMRKQGYSKEEILADEEEFLKNFNTSLSELNRMIGYGPVGEEKPVVASKPVAKKPVSTTKKPSATVSVPKEPVATAEEPVDNGFYVEEPRVMSKYGYPITDTDKNGNSFADDIEHLYLGDQEWVISEHGHPITGTDKDGDGWNDGSLKPGTPNPFSMP